MKLFWQIYRLQLKETFAIAHGNYNFRNCLQITLQKNNCFGYGECTEIDYYQINLANFEVILKQIQAQIESQKIIHPTQFYQFLLHFNLHSFLLSALDCAYWDLFCKLENKTFFELNSINFQKIPQSSLTISIAKFEDQLKKMENSKWKKFKVKCQGFNADYIQKLAQLPNIALDSNGSFTTTDCKFIENQTYGKFFDYIEQPMPINKYQNLNKKSTINWIADEDLQTILQLESLNKNYQSVNIKLVKCGGLTPALQLIEKAKLLKLKIMIGCMTETTIGISAAAVLAPFADFLDLDGAFLLSNDNANGTKIINGNVVFSQQNGLGISII